MHTTDIRAIDDWSARSQAASRALTAELKSVAQDLERALELVEILDDWAAGRLSYWFDLAEQPEPELEWTRRAVEALRRQLVHTPSVRGLLGLTEDKLGRLLVARGELDEAGELFEAALEHVSHWEDASRSVRGALKSVAKKKRKRGRQSG